MDKTAFCLFEESGTFKQLLEPYYNTIAVDIQNGVDILKWDYKKFDNVEFIVSHPPCTEFAVSGAGWWAKKPPELLQHAVKLVNKTLEIIDYHKPKIWFIENPVGRIESCCPELKQVFKWSFHPYQFAGYSDSPDKEAYTKKTILWGQFRPPKVMPVEPKIKDYILSFSPGPERKKMRSKTPQGFARAFVSANINYNPPIQLKLF